MLQNKFLILGGLLLTLISCNSSSTVSGDNSSLTTVNLTKKILASNVILAEVQAEEGVDRTTKVLASNVVLNSQGLGIPSTDVQGAFQAITPDVATFIVGTWAITDVGRTLNSSPDFTDELGTITFKSDGTFSINLVSDAKQKTLSLLYLIDYIKTHTPTSSTYRVIDNMALMLRVTSSDTPPSNIYNLGLSIVRTTSNKIQLTANSGIVILTRE